jgi:hypothetical protein
MADKTRTAAVATPKSQRQGSFVKWKSVVSSVVLVMTMITVINNTTQFMNPALSKLTNNGNEMIRQLETAMKGIMGDVTDFGDTNLTLVEKNGDHNVGMQSHTRPLSRHESLTKLTRVTETTTCPSEMKAVEMISNPEADAAVGRKIPKIVHMTGKTKCLTVEFFDAAKQWQFQHHSFYFHDDQALEELFNKDWPMFPHLKNSLLCLNQAGGGKKRPIMRNAFTSCHFCLMLPFKIVSLG